MYLRGLKGEWDDAYEWPSSNTPVISSFPSLPQSVPMPSNLPPTVSADWTSVFKQALQTWGTVAQGNAQVEIAKARIQSPYGYSTMPGTMVPGSTFPYSPLSQPGMPGYLPFPGVANSGTIFGIPTGIVLIGAAVIAAVLIARN